jgi:hypothetical protein
MDKRSQSMSKIGEINLFAWLPILGIPYTFEKSRDILVRNNKLLTKSLIEQVEDTVSNSNLLIDSGL